MAFSVPTLSDVSRTIENGFSSAFYGKSGVLRVGVLKVISKVVAGGCYLPILFCNYIWRNSFIDSCDVDNLVRFGGWYNLPHKVATPARGDVSVHFSGVATIPAGTILVEPNSGNEYETLESVSGNSSAIVRKVNVVALTAGAQGDLNGENLKFRDVEISNVNIYANVISGGASFDVSVNGVVEQWGESVESYRQRLKFRRQNPPMGGAKSDYKTETEKFNAVSEAYVLPNYPTTNSVSVLVADYNNKNCSVSASDVAEIQTYLTADSRKQVTANIVVRSVTAVEIKLRLLSSDISDEFKSRVGDVLKNNLRGYGYGKTLTIDNVSAILKGEISDVNFSVSQMWANNVDVSTNGYTFALTTQSAEIVNINTIGDNITLTKA